MQLPSLHFAPANGFHGLGYGEVFNPLAKKINFASLHLPGHNPNFAVTNNWPLLRDELLANVAANFSAKQVVGVGHSLGGVLTYLAALKQPQKFSKIILLDPPLFTGSTSWALKLAKRLGFIDKVTPAGITKGRRSSWPSKQAAVDYFKGKNLFKNFTQQALEDYVAFGTQDKPAASGVELVFKPRVEIEIFRSLPDNLAFSLKKQRVEVHLIYGKGSNLLKPKQLKSFAKRGFHLYGLEGGHMFPLENPQATSQLIEQIITG